MCISLGMLVAISSVAEIIKLYDMFGHVSRTAKSSTRKSSSAEAKNKSEAFNDYSYVCWLFANHFLGTLQLSSLIHNAHRELTK